MTIGELNQELATLAAQINTKSKVMKEYYRLEKELYNNRLEEERLVEQLRKEQKDVDRLTSISIQSIYHAFKGTKDVELHKQQGELMVAKAKLDQYRLVQENLKKDLEEANKKRNDIPEMEHKYAELLKQKKRIIRSKPSAIGKSLSSKMTTYETLKKQEKELYEAIQAGVTSQDALTDAVQLLESANRWGTFDLFTRGSMIAHAIKYERIDRAQEILLRVQSTLRTFQRELNDVHLVVSNLSLNITTADRVFDFWLDNVFTDMHILAQIGTSLDDARKTLSQVTIVLTTIKEHMKEHKHKLLWLQREIDTIIQSV